MLWSVPPSPSSCPELPVIADLGYRKILPIQQMHLVIDIASCCRNLLVWDSRWKWWKWCLGLCASGLLYYWSYNYILKIWLLILRQLCPIIAHRIQISNSANAWKSFFSKCLKKRILWKEVALDKKKKLAKKMSSKCINVKLTCANKERSVCWHPGAC